MTIGLSTVVAAWAVLQAGAVPPPAEQFTADCENPVFATDQLVCADPSLRRMDAQLADGMTGFVRSMSRWIEPQSAWYLRRSRCAFEAGHRSCAMSAYAERLVVILPLRNEARSSEATCDDPGIEAVVVEHDRLVLVGPGQRIMGVAPTSLSDRAWKPYLSGVRTGNRLKFTTVGGDVLRCRMGRAFPFSKERQ